MIASRLEGDLRRVGTAERARRQRAYLKSDLEFAGATVPQARAVAREFWRSRKALDRPELLTLASVLWQTRLYERKAVAVELLTRFARRLSAEDLRLVERFVRQARTWALVDPLAGHVAGDVVTRCPESLEVLDDWAVDDDFWVRRAALLALLHPLRESRSQFNRFSMFADRMLEDKEFFVRKAIGWVLRDISRKWPTLVASWVEPRAGRMSGVTIREATRYLQPDVRDRLMEMYRARPRARGGAARETGH